MFSKLKNHESTQAQRGWTMSWFIIGMIAGYTMPLGQADLDSRLRYSYMDIDKMEEHVSPQTWAWGKGLGQLVFFWRLQLEDLWSSPK
jgi:hypothetical protein